MAQLCEPFQRSERPRCRVCCLGRSLARKTFGKRIRGMTGSRFRFVVSSINNVDSESAAFFPKKEEDGEGAYALRWRFLCGDPTSSGCRFSRRVRRTISDAMRMTIRPFSSQISFPFRIWSHRRPFFKIFFDRVFLFGIFV